MCDELVKKVIAINLNKQNPDKKIEDVDKTNLIPVNLLKFLKWVDLQK